MRLMTETQKNGEYASAIAKRTLYAAKGGARGCATGKQGRVMGLKLAILKTSFCDGSCGATMEEGISDGAGKAVCETEHIKVQHGQDFS